MLEFFRRHRGAFLIVLTVIIIVSFSFWGGWGRTRGDQVDRNATAFKIYGKEYTYREGMTPEEMGAVAMRNYDPAFQAIARRGDILVGGRNFGSGSSREQAATALKHRGISLVIAGSYSQTYKRNVELSP